MTLTGRKRGASLALYIAKRKPMKFPTKDVRPAPSPGACSDCLCHLLHHVPHTATRKVMHIPEALEPDDYIFWCPSILVQAVDMTVGCCKPNLRLHTLRKTPDTNPHKLYGRR